MKIKFVFFLKMMSVGHVLDHVLDHIILGLVTMTLQLPFSLVLAPTNKELLVSYL